LKTLGVLSHNNISYTFRYIFISIFRRLLKRYSLVFFSAWPLMLCCCRGVQAEPLQIFSCSTALRFSIFDQLSYLILSLLLMHNILIRNHRQILNEKNELWADVACRVHPLFNLFVKRLKKEPLQYCDSLKCRP
jgi:hypothetical protein